MAPTPAAPPSLVLDGAIGTELERLGVDTSGPAWTARAVREAPEVLRGLHAAYAAAGATVHTAATFRATRRALGAGWASTAAEAVALCRGAVPSDHRVAGSVAPLEDCWHPERAPDDGTLRREHGALADVLAAAGADLLLVETFASVREATVAATAALRTGRPVWVALTPGPFATPLLRPAEAVDAARRLRDLGVERVLANCLPCGHAGAWVDALAAAGVPWGLYPNGGVPPIAPDALGRLAAGWWRAGAGVIGGCCHTGPVHVAALARARP